MYADHSHRPKVLDDGYCGVIHGHVAGFQYLPG
jgi:hypothetical protein